MLPTDVLDLFNRSIDAELEKISPAERTSANSDYVKLTLFQHLLKKERLIKQQLIRLAGEITPLMPNAASSSDQPDISLLEKIKNDSYFKGILEARYDDMRLYLQAKEVPPASNPIRMYFQWRVTNGDTHLLFSAGEQGEWVLELISAPNDIQTIFNRISHKVMRRQQASSVAINLTVYRAILNSSERLLTEKERTKLEKLQQRSKNEEKYLSKNKLVIDSFSNEDSVFFLDILKRWLGFEERNGDFVISNMLQFKTMVHAFSESEVVTDRTGEKTRLLMTMAANKPAVPARPSSAASSGATSPARISTPIVVTPLAHPARRTSSAADSAPAGPSTSIVVRPPLAHPASRTSSAADSAPAGPLTPVVARRGLTEHPLSRTPSTAAASDLVSTIVVVEPVAVVIPAPAAPVPTFSQAPGVDTKSLVVGAAKRVREEGPDAPLFFPESLFGKGNNNGVYRAPALIMENHLQGLRAHLRSKTGAHAYPRISEIMAATQSLLSLLRTYQAKLSDADAIDVDAVANVNQALVDDLYRSPSDILIATLAVIKLIEPLDSTEPTLFKSIRENLMFHVVHLYHFLYESDISTTASSFEPSFKRPRREIILGNVVEEETMMDFIGTIMGFSRDINHLIRSLDAVKIPNGDAAKGLKELYSTLITSMKNLDKGLLNLADNDVTLGSPIQELLTGVIISTGIIAKFSSENIRAGIEGLDTILSKIVFHLGQLLGISYQTKIYDFMSKLTPPAAPQTQSAPGPA